MRAPRRLAGICALSLAAALVAAPLSPAAPDARADDRRPAARTVTEAPLRIATFNTNAPQSVDKAMQDISMVASQAPDVIALQEMSSPAKRRLLRETLVDCETCLYDAYMPQSAVPGGTPILYRADRFTLLGVETVQATPATYVGRAGAGPSTIYPKYINVVRLRDNISMRRINVLNNHAVPSVQGKNGGPNKKMGKRLAIYQKHMNALVATITRIKATSGGYFFVTGDLNVNFRRDKVLKPSIFPYATMKRARLRASFDTIGMPKRGTHTLGNGNSKRLIDYVYADRRPQVTPVRQKVYTRVNSDHRPVVVDFTVRTVKKYAPVE